MTDAPDPGGWDRGEAAPAPAPDVPELDAVFQPGSDVARAVDGLLAALRSDAAKLMAAQAEVAERQAAETLERADREAAEIVGKATRLEEAAKAALEQAGRRYEGVLRIVGQLIGGVTEIREQLATDLQGLHRQAREIERGTEEPPGGANGNW